MTWEQLRAAVEARLSAMRAALNKLEDGVAVDVTALFEQWQPGREYIAGQRLRDGDRLYRVVQTHVSQEGWRPEDVPALFVEIPKPGEIPDWKQPHGAQDAYRIGDKVRHNGHIWQCTVDYNVYEPGVYGWEQCDG